MTSDAPKIKVECTTPVKIKQEPIEETLLQQIAQHQPNLQQEAIVEQPVQQQIPNQQQSVLGQLVEQQVLTEAKKPSYTPWASTWGYGSGNNRGGSVGL